MNRVQHPSVRTVLGALLLTVLGAAAGYWFARTDATNGGRVPSLAAVQTTRTRLYWYDPMRPDQHFAKPGKSPYMDMQLVPRFADESRSREVTNVRIDPALLQNLGVRTTPVERLHPAQSVEAVGSITFDQRNIAVIQAKGNGFVSREYARAPGDIVNRDAPIADLLIPEWAGAQSEYLTLLKTGDASLADAARDRLRSLGMSRGLIAAVEKQRKPQLTVTVSSPIAGVIDSLDVREGMAVSIGNTLAKVNGFGSVWLEASVPEAQGALAQVGNHVDADLTAFPGQRFTGSVIAVLPQANSDTRTLRIRVELDNKAGKLRPGMFARVRMENSSEKTELFVPTEAVIRTGTREVVIVASDKGGFVPVEVQAGAEVGAKTEILDGLTEGQRVVTSGQFLIDSEASLRGVLARMTGSHSNNTSDEAAEEHP